MALTATKNKSNSNKVEQPVLEAGVYPGRSLQIIDMGLQPQRPFKGAERPPAHELMLTYELSDEFMKDENGNDIEDKPRLVSEIIPFYPISNDKAKSTKRYYALDPKEERGGDFSQLTDIPLNITLVNNMSGERTYTNIASIAQMRPRDAQNCPDLKNTPKVFDLDLPDLETFNSLPQWVQDKIKGNLNYKGSALEKLLSGKPSPSKPKQEDISEDNPF